MNDKHEESFQALAAVTTAPTTSTGKAAFGVKYQTKIRQYLLALVALASLFHRSDSAGALMEAITYLDSQFPPKA